MSKKKWDKLPLMTWKFTMYKEDEQGNQKFYEYTGDHSFCTEGIDVEDLNEIEKNMKNSMSGWILVLLNGLNLVTQQVE